MANPEHLAVFMRGVDSFNKWRAENVSITPDLSEANLFVNLSATLENANVPANLKQLDLSEANLSQANLCHAHLVEADLSETNLHEANLVKANLTMAQVWKSKLTKADLSEANLCKAKLSGANLTSAYLIGADLRWANLSDADLRWADLSRAVLSDANLKWADLSGAWLAWADLSRANFECASLVDTDLEDAIINDCRIYGISAWNVNLVKARQENLVITPEYEATITVDSLEVAQFIYLLLNNGKIREVIDTITSKVVLILGRFTPGRKAVLDTIREELRKRNYLPVLYDFDKPTSRNLTETVSTLAHMARFIIADITDVRSIPQELMAIVPHLPSVPVQPLLLASDKEYGLFIDFRAYPWVLEPFIYDDRDTLLASLGSVVSQVEIKCGRPTIAKHIDARCDC